jgi:hypothetical protein
VGDLIHPVSLSGLSGLHNISTPVFARDFRDPKFVVGQKVNFIQSNDVEGFNLEHGSNAELSGDVRK